MKRPDTKLLNLAPQAGLSAGKTGIQLPAVITQAGRKAERRFLEFFTAHIRNPNTRQAYGQPVRQFLRWCEDRGLETAVDDSQERQYGSYLSILQAAARAPTTTACMNPSSIFLRSAIGAR